MIKKVIKKQKNGKDCIVCGMQSEHSLRTAFYEMEDGTVVAVAQPRSFHQSYPGRVHGGIITALLDETIGRAVQVGEPDMWGVTAELTTRYKKPVPYDVPLLVTGRITENNRRLFRGEGALILPNGQVAATAKATYMKLPLDNISDFDAESDDWMEYPLAEEPAFFDLPEGV